LATPQCRGSDYNPKACTHDGKNAQHFAKKRMDLLRSVAAATAAAGSYVRLCERRGIEKKDCFHKNQLLK
jgi:hypothetical protein